MSDEEEEGKAEEKKLLVILIIDAGDASFGSLSCTCQGRESSAVLNRMLVFFLFFPPYPWFCNRLDCQHTTRCRAHFYRTEV